MSHLGLLRSALWGDPRIVTYGSSQLDDLPGSFIFESRLIFCGNVIPRERRLQGGALARCDIFQLDATQEEVVDLMRSVASAGYETLSPDDCQDVVSFIEQNGDDWAISLRLLEPCFRKVLYATIGGAGLASAGHDATEDSWAQGRHVPPHRCQGSGDSHCSIRRLSGSLTL